ncbi:MAG: MBL fold metallo-hydrolase [Pseudomonadota bacterium]
MRKIFFMILGFVLCCSLSIAAPIGFEEDIIPTSAGELKISFIGHGSLIFTIAGTVIHIDPWNNLADYALLPKADIVLITHEHRDHLDSKSIEAVRKKETTIIMTEKCLQQFGSGKVMKNGDEMTIHGIGIEAVPAYNIVHKRDTGQLFHPRGEGNGYILTIGGKRIYVAGDTENIPEMKELAPIDCAFLPMNLPYTMTPEMVADAARSFRPRILYPYHYGDTDPAQLVRLLQDHKDIEVRIRRMQ